MKVKECVLETLEANRGEYISGEALAKKIGVSRQAVGKAVNALKRDGYALLASTNRGYMLPTECDVLSAKQIGAMTGTRVLLFDSVTSTNSVAAAEYRADGQCIVVSRTQTDGRKKDGGKFFSPQDKGIYISIALPLDVPVGALVGIRRICGKAVAEVIADSCGKEAVCEREDEIYIGGKKVAGILVECNVIAATLRTESAVIGIGIYTNENFIGSGFDSVFPADTRNKMIADIYNKITGALTTRTWQF